LVTVGTKTAANKCTEHARAKELYYIEIKFCVNFNHFNSPFEHYTIGYSAKKLN